MQFKILNHFYWTPSRLFRLGLKDSELCWKCGVTEGSLIHAFWPCPMITQYQIQIHCYIANVVKCNFDFCPKLYILGDDKALSAFSKPITNWIQTSIMTGRQIILRNWKKPGEPPFSCWVTELGTIAAYERMSYRMQDRMDKYLLKWGHFLNSINKSV